MILLMAMWFCFRFEMQLLTSLSNDIVEEGSQRDNKSLEQGYGWPGRARRWHRATRNHPPSPTPLRRQGKLFTNNLNALIFQNVPYVYVSKQDELGRACGVSRNIVAATVLRNPEGALNSQVVQMKDKVEQLLLWRDLPVQESSEWLLALIE